MVTTASDPVQALELNWEVIRDELRQFLGESSDGEFANKYTKGWAVLGIYVKEAHLLESGKNEGQTARDKAVLERNNAIVREQLQRTDGHFPETLRLVKDIPGIKRAGFSRMKPDTHIVPHRAPFHPFLRLHLGLVVPEPELCALNANGNLGHWSEGECLIFDETIVHEAWNKGTQDRVVLIVDIERDPLLESLSGRDQVNGKSVLLSDNPPAVATTMLRVRFFCFRALKKLKKMVRG